MLRADECGQDRATDNVIMGTVLAAPRILVTLDEHFGEWAVLPLHRHYGVIRLKVHPTMSKNVLRLLLPFLRANKARDFRNHLVIVSDSKVRWVRTAE